MSAGDVLFVGWTGGDPQYKELAPTIELEPAGDGLVSKRVTINRLCFDKDKQAVVQGLPTGNAVINSNYVDTDGSVKDQFLGGGYDLVSVSNAPVGVGYSRVSAVYQKIVDSTFEIGLPAGLSITCSAGSCQIVYNGNVLEEIDSGTGECTSGITTVGQIVGESPYFIRPFYGNIREETLITQSDDDYDPAPLYDQAYYVLYVSCNGFVFEEVVVAGSDLKVKKINEDLRFFSETRTQSPKFRTLAELKEWEEENAISQEEIDELLNEYRSQYPDKEYAKNSFSFRRERELKRGGLETERIDLDDGLIVTDPETGETTEVFFIDETYVPFQVIYTDVVSRFVTYSFPTNIRQINVLSRFRPGGTLPKTSIVKKDNTIQFLLDHPSFKQPIVWRKYDVTGM